MKPIKTYNDDLKHDGYFIKIEGTIYWVALKNLEGITR